MKTDKTLSSHRNKQSLKEQVAAIAIETDAFLSAIKRKVNMGQAAGNQAVQPSAKHKTPSLVVYDVFESVIVGNPQFQWTEQFYPVGTVKAFNSVHAMEVAKKEFPKYASRIAVMSSRHPQSPTACGYWEMVERSNQATVNNLLASKGLPNVF